MATTNKRDWVLLALALANGSPLSPVQIQKTIFLFGKLLSKEALPESFYEFSADNYGPFCGEIYDDVRQLAAEGLVSIGKPSYGNYFLYAATQEGIKQGMAFAKTLPSSVVDHARRIVVWVQAQTFRSLVAAIYQAYPEYRANSIFKG